MELIPAGTSRVFDTSVVNIHDVTQPYDYIDEETPYRSTPPTIISTYAATVAAAAAVVAAAAAAAAVAAAEAAAAAADAVARVVNGCVGTAEEDLIVHHPAHRSCMSVPRLCGK